MFSSVYKIVIYTVLLWLTVLTSPGFCYLDPGTGSYFIQILIAGVAGLGLAVKIYWNRIKAFFSSLFFKKEEEGGQGEMKLK